MGRRGMHIGYWLENQKKRDLLKDQDRGGCIILKWTFERQDGMVWTRFIWLRTGTSGGLLLTW
jgi:hypothetical protein